MSQSSDRLVIVAPVGADPRSLRDARRAVDEHGFGDRVMIVQGAGHVIALRGSGAPTAKDG